MAHLKQSNWILVIVSVALVLGGCGGDNVDAAPSVAADVVADPTIPVKLSLQSVSTFAKAAAFNGDGLTIDKSGNIYVGTSKGGTVYKVTPAGQASLFATFPTGATANGSDVDSKGNLYVANEAQNIVHKITPSGTVSNFATNLDGPAGIYVDENDNVIVALYGDLATKATASKVVKIAPDQTITTLASGNGLLNVVGITGDGRGRYFAANFKNGELFEITGGVVKQIHAGGARVNHMKYYAGYLYMPNPLDHVIRRTDLTGNMETLAGIKATAASVDGPVATATFARPNSIDVSADGKTIYVLEFDTGHIRAISTSK
jgi:sugar lactone lactonase YvrE